MSREQGRQPLPPKVAAAFDHLRRPKNQNPDGLDWARRILAKKRSGLPVAAATLEMARQALEGRGNNDERTVDDGTPAATPAPAAPAAGPDAHQGGTIF